MSKLPQFIKEQGETYTIDISSKNIEITPPLKDYILEKIQKMERITKHFLEIDVRLEVQKFHNIVSILVCMGSLRIKMLASADNMYASIDIAFAKLETKLRRWKEQIQNHRTEKLGIVDLMVNVLHKPSDLIHINEIIEDRGSPSSSIELSTEESVEEFNQELEDWEKIYYSEENWIPKVKKTKVRSLKTLTLQEAIMKMELSGDNFLLYRSEEDLKLRIVYRRRDDSFGVIEIDNSSSK